MTDMRHLKGGWHKLDLFHKWLILTSLADLKLYWFEGFKSFPKVTLFLRFQISLEGLKAL